MRILLTNDDGYDAPGIIELAKQVQQHAEVFIVAPRTEQSGVSQAITFLRPVYPRPIKVQTGESAIDGYSVDGTPVDCVKLALFDLCPWKPDLILSGINGGLNAGSNTAYSGTVAAALCGVTLGVPSIAVSLESGQNVNFQRAAELTWPSIERIASAEFPPHTIYNINVPTKATTGEPETVVVPVEMNPLGYEFDRGADPKGRKYYWANCKPDPVPSPFETDASALKAGKISISAISCDMNSRAGHQELQKVFGARTTA